MKPLITILLSCTSLFVYAQTYITIPNPSFEESYGIGSSWPEAPMVEKWTDCGPLKETPPDVHTNSSNFFNVEENAQHGNNFLGMVTRDNQTWESLSCQLSDTLYANTAYVLQLYAQRSAEYRSISKVTGQSASYTTPSIIRIWGDNIICAKNELLALSHPVKNETWELYTFALQPKSHCTFLRLEVYYAEEGDYTNGSVLIDNIQPIILAEEYNGTPIEIEISNKVSTPAKEESQKKVAEIQPPTPVHKTVKISKVFLDTIHPKKLQLLVLQYIENPSHVYQKQKNIQFLLIQKASALQTKLQTRGALGYIRGNADKTIEEEINALPEIGAHTEYKILQRCLQAKKDFNEGIATQASLMKMQDFSNQFEKEEDIAQKLLDYVDKNRDEIAKGFE